MAHIIDGAAVSHLLKPNVGLKSTPLMDTDLNYL